MMTVHRFMSSALKEKNKGEISTLIKNVLTIFGRLYFFSKALIFTVLYEIWDSDFVFDVRTPQLNLREQCTRTRS